MKKENQKMPEKIKMAKVSLIILGCVGTIASFAIIGFTTFFSFLLLLGASSASKGGTGALVLAIIYLLMGFFFSIVYIFFAVFGFLTAKKITERKKWVKTMGIILSVLAIMFGHFIGMALGVLILIGLLDGDTENWFIK